MTAAVWLLKSFGGFEAQLCSSTDNLSSEIGRLDPKGLTRDTSGTKNYATFLTELGERVPGTVLQSLALILPLLDGEV